jgi:hypothetical protein
MPRNAASQANQSTQNKNPVPSADDVDKIRDIIFGGQMREYADRFESLEKGVGETIERLSKDIEKRFEQIESSLQGQVQKISQQLTREKEQRKTELGAAKHQVRDLGKLINARTAETDERVAAEVDELHGVLEQEHKALGELIEKSRAELGKLLARETKRLERDKLASKELAQLFTEIARNLRQNGK